MKGTLLLLTLLVVTGVSFAQKQKTSDVQKLKMVLDSSRNVLKTDVQRYHSKVDSVNNAQYQRQLERSLGVENSKDTFYGTVFTIVAVLITFLAIFIGYNFFATARESKRQLRELSDASNKTLEEQRSATNKTLEEQRNNFQIVLNNQAERFTALETQAKEYQEAYQKNLQDQIDNFRERVAALKREGATTEERFEELDKEVKRLTELNKPSVTVEVNQIECFKCGKPIPVERRTVVGDPGGKIFGTVTPRSFVLCPHCGTANPVYEAKDPAQGAIKAVFGSTDAAFGSTKAVFGSTEAVFGTSKPKKD